MDIDVSDDLISDDPSRRAKAFQYLYGAGFEKVKALIIKNHGTVPEAEDIFQDGLVALYHNISTGKFKRTAKAETYLYSICKNLWFQKLRKTRKNDDFSEEMKLALDDRSIKTVNTSFLNRVFGELKADCQKILKEFYYHNKSIVELRKSMKMESDQVVKNKKGRCLKYLMNIIRQKNLTMESFFE